MANTVNEDKPISRGYIHRVSFYLYLLFSIFILWKTRSGIPRYSMAIYLATLINLYGISSVLHVTSWNCSVAESRLTRIDHSSIFLLIAGSYSPMCLVCVPPSAKWGVQLLIGVWIIAIGGIVKCMVWTKCPRGINVVFYFICGLSVVPFIPETIQVIGWKDMIYVIVGGAMYLIGGVVYGTRRPNPSPSYFGFHEIFHLLTVTANLCFLHPMMNCVTR